MLHHNSSITKRLHLTFDESTMLETSKIDVGFGAKDEIRTVLVKQGNPQELQRLRALVKDFRRECRECLKSMAKKMIIRTPLSSAFIQGCAALDPAIICSSDEKSELLSQSLLILVQLKWLSGDEADTIKRKYRTLCTSPAFIERMKSYRRGIDRLDNFLVKEFDTLNDSTMLKFLQLIFCLSHGQADVERGFSTNKDLMVENLKEGSLMAQRVIKDHIRRRCEGDVKNFQISKDIVMSVNSARRRYRLALEEEKKRSKPEESAESAQKRKAAEKLADLEDRQKRAKAELERVTKEMKLLQK